MNPLVIKSIFTSSTTGEIHPLSESEIYERLRKYICSKIWKQHLRETKKK